MRNAASSIHFRDQWLRICRAPCTALMVLPLIACAALGATDYKFGMAYHNHGLYWQAKNSFVEGARAGNANAQNMLGWYWANGLGHLPKNIVNACNWYATAADKGLPDAINNLGACYEYPGFAQHDMNRAIALYTLAARKGNSKAQENLVRLGRPVPPADLTPRQPVKQEAPQPVRVVSQPQPVVREASQQPVSQDSSSGDKWVALAVAALNVFAASKGYGTAPAPVFIPPPAINVHCTSQMVGQTALTNCY